MISWDVAQSPKGMLRLSERAGCKQQLPSTLIIRVQTQRLLTEMYHVSIDG